MEKIKSTTEQIFSALLEKNIFPTREIILLFKPERERLKISERHKNKM